VRRAASGLRAWLIQRVTAVYMLLFLVFVLLHFLLARPASYLAWRAWIADPAVGIGGLVFFAGLLAPLWIGVRDVILDYVKPLAVRVAALAFLGLGLAGLGASMMRNFFRVNG
jgi:succinate dehydrogenase / fumarate reductase, membrane anchor subunit